MFKSLGLVGTSSSLLTTGVFGCVKTAITLVWLFFLIDKLGRRFLLLFGAVSGSLCMWYIGGYIKISDPSKHVHTNPVTGAETGGKLTSGGISAIFFFYLWTVCYTPSWNGTPWVLNSEMFIQGVRTLAQAWAAANNWLWNFIIARFTPQMFDSMGSSGYGVYFFFSSMMILSIPFVYFLIPETKGIPLEAMDRLFAKDVPASKAHKTVLAELRMDDQQFRRESIQARRESAPSDELEGKEAYTQYETKAEV